jgi:hypothetical protein
MVFSQNVSPMQYTQLESSGERTNKKAGPAAALVN